MWPWKIKQQNSTQLRAHHTSPSDDAEQRPNPSWLDITSTYPIQVECAALDEETGCDGKSQRAMTSPRETRFFGLAQPVATDGIEGSCDRGGDRPITRE